MRLSRTHLVPVLAIVAGGVLGASLSFGFLTLSPSGDVRAIVPIVSVEVDGYPVATKERVAVEVNGYPVATAERTGDGMVITPVVVFPMSLWSSPVKEGNAVSRAFFRGLKLTVDNDVSIRVAP